MIWLALLAALMLGAAAALADGLMRRRARRAAVESRLALIAPGAQGNPAAAQGGVLSVLDRIYAAIQRLFAAGVSRRWGVKHSPLLLFVSALLGGACMWLIAHVMLKQPIWISLPLTLAASLAPPRIMLDLEQRGLEAHFLERFPDTIDMVVRMLRAGVPLTATVRAVAAESAPPVNAVFTGLADQTDIGVPLDEALEAAAKWIKLPDFRFFAEAVALQYATGGNLAVTLESLSDIVRKRRTMRLRARAVSAEVRLSTYILGGLPILVVAVLLVVSPDYLSPLITDPRGNWILGAAIGMLLTGFYIMRRMMISVSRV